MSGQVMVNLGERSYPIAFATESSASGAGKNSFGAFAREALEAAWAGRGCTRAVIVTDANVAPLATAYEQSLSGVGIATERVVVAPGEASKSIASASAIYDRLIEIKADRRTPIIAIGGGVIGDLAGFVAATFARGVPLVMVPTTLLAQVDSSVGGKVGVNHPLAKNIIGAFHQPAGVWIDPKTLATLPARELRSGIAEVIKYGVIKDASLFMTLEERIERLLGLEPESVREAVAVCCRIKAEVVAGDEREETGLRAILNFGHTVGHAIEAAAGYGRYLHGEAVAAGMVAEAELALRIGRLDAAAVDRLRRLVVRSGLPDRAPGLDPAALIEAMSRDKKNRGGRIGFVLPNAIGSVELSNDVPDRLVLETIESLTRG